MDAILLWNALNSIAAASAVAVGVRIVWAQAQQALMVRTLWEAWLAEGRSELKRKGLNPHPPTMLAPVTAQLAASIGSTAGMSDTAIAHKIMRALGPEQLARMAEDAHISLPALVAALVNGVR